MMTTVRLSYIRQLLRKGHEFIIQHLDQSDTVTAITGFGSYDKDQYSEWLSVSTSHLDGSTMLSSHVEIHDCAQQILKLLNRNHDIKVENIWEQKNQLKSVISIQWTIDLISVYGGSVFGNFTPSQLEKIESTKNEKVKKQKTQLDMIKSLVDTYVQCRKDGDFYDSDREIDQSLDLLLECNQDMKRPLYASDYLAKGEFPPIGMECDRKAMEGAIESKKLELIKWVFNQKYPIKTHEFRQVFHLGYLDIAEYLIEDRKIKMDPEWFYYAVLSGNRDLIDYLLRKKVDTSFVAMVLHLSDVDKPIWELFKYVYFQQPFILSDTAFRRHLNNPEIFSWLLCNNAPRQWGVFDAASEGQLDQLKELLETPINDQKLNVVELFEKAFSGLLFSKKDISTIKDIYSYLIKQKLFEKITISDLVDNIYNEQSITIFEYAQECLTPEEWNRILTPQIATKIYSQKPVIYFDKLRAIDFKLALKLASQSQKGLNKIVFYFNDQYGSQWPSLIDQSLHNLIMGSTQSPVYANKLGFKVFRSIYKQIGYRRAEELFELEVIVCEDDPSWNQQVNIFNEHIFKNQHIKQLDPNKKYRILVFGHGCEYLGSDGFFREIAIYDIQNATIIGQDTDVYKLEGSNNGPLKTQEFSEGEPQWTNQVLPFYLEFGENRISIYTGRDGGSLNCWGGYYVRIVPQ